MKRPHKKSDKKTTRRVAKKTHTPTIADIRFQEIKPFVNIKNDGSEYSKRKIRTAWRILHPLIQQPHVTLKSRSKKQIKIAAKAVGANDAARAKWLKAVPVPSGDVDEMVARVRGGRLVTETAHTSLEYIDFDPEELAEGEGKYVRGLLRDFKGSQQFQIQAGKYHIAQAFSKSAVPDEVARLMEKYSAGNVVEIQRRTHTEKREITEANSYENWLHGLIRYTGKNQIAVKDFITRQETEKQAAYAEAKRERNKARAQKRYKRNKRKRG